MQSSNDKRPDFSNWVEDMSRLAGSFVGGLTHLRHEVEGMVKQQVQRVLHGLDLVTREEFEAMRGIATKAREEQEALKARLDALESSQTQASKSQKKGQ